MGLWNVTFVGGLVVRIWALTTDEVREQCAELYPDNTIKRMAEAV